MERLPLTSCMRFFWVLLLFLLRPLYLAYAWWCRLFIWVLVLALLLGDRHNTWVSTAIWLSASALVLSALWGVWRVWQLRQSSDPNPWQSAFMAWFGTLKLFRNAGDAAAVRLHWPSVFLVENPRGYRIGGPDTRAILDRLLPGDILLRGYEGYVDGLFIRQSSLSAGRDFRAGWFTHAALYVGPLDAQDRTHVPAAFHKQPDYFAPGPQMVVHAMAKGVHCEDILTFLRCDYLCVLRVSPLLRLDPQSAPAPIPWHQRPNQVSQSEQMHTNMWRALEAGQTISHAEVVMAARQSALEKIGEAYDFDCSDTRAFNRFSCAELVYYCLRGVLRAIKLSAQAHAFYPLAPTFQRLRLLERTTVTPDDIHDLVAGGAVQQVWIDAVSAAKTAPNKHAA